MVYTCKWTRAQSCIQTRAYGACACMCVDIYVQMSGHVYGHAHQTVCIESLPSMCVDLRSLGFGSGIGSNGSGVNFLHFCRDWCLRRVSSHQMTRHVQCLQRPDFFVGHGPLNQESRQARTIHTHTTVMGMTPKRTTQGDERAFWAVSTPLPYR